MKKILTITLLVLLTVGLLVSCNADAVSSVYTQKEREPLLLKPNKQVHVLSGLQALACRSFYFKESVNRKLWECKPKTANSNKSLIFSQSKGHVSSHRIWFLAFMRLVLL